MKPLPEPNPVIREEFLVEFGETEHGKALRRFGTFLYSMACQSFFMDQGASNVQELRALLVDLEAVGQGLEVYSREYDFENARLRRSAAAWARQVRRIAAAMEEALGKLEAAR